MSVTASAVVSPCGTYRYELRRTWDPERRSVLWIMLNPSTADADQDDATIRRCVGFARAWGAGGIIVANLYALRSTDPRALRTHPAPIGPDNDSHLRRLATDRREVHIVVAAWGANPAARTQGPRVTAMLDRGCGVTLWRLGATRDGSPRHPLYVPADTRPEQCTGAGATGGNACRYCFSPLPWEDEKGRLPWYCPGGACTAADARRRDSRAEVLDAHRAEPVAVAAGPDQAELWP